MGFRHPLRDVVDQVARDAAAAAGVPQKTLSTADTGPRVVIEQVPIAGEEGSPFDQTSGIVRFVSSNGDDGILSLTTTTQRRRLLLDAGSYGTHDAPYLAMSATPSEADPAVVLRAAAFVNVDYLETVGDSRAARFVQTGDNYGYTSAAPEPDWTSTISRYTRRQGEIVYTCRITRKNADNTTTWPANARIFVWPAGTWPAENMTYWSGSSEIILRASDGVMYLPAAGSGSVQFAATWPIG